MAKYSGSNSYKLSYLPQDYRDAYELGYLSDEEVDALLEQVQSQTVAPDAASIAAGPLTPQEEQTALGFESAGGADAGTSRAAAAAMSSDLRNRQRGIGQMFEDGAFLSAGGAGPLANLLPGGQLLDTAQYYAGEATGILPSLRERFRSLTGADTEETQTQRGLDRAFAEGRALSTGLAYERAGELGKLAIDAAPNISQAGTALAAMLATRNPAMAAAVGGMSMADIGSSVLGNSYLEGIEAGLSPREALNRAEHKLGVELSTELLVPGGGKTTNIAKAIARQVGYGGAQEAGAQLGSNILDDFVYGDNEALKPESLTEGVGRAATLGAVLGGVIAGPAAVMDARATARERNEQFDWVTRNMDEPMLEGFTQGRKLIEQAKEPEGPAQGDLFGEQPDLPRQTEEQRQAKLERDAAALLKQRAAERDQEARKKAEMDTAFRQREADLRDLNTENELLVAIDQAERSGDDVAVANAYKNLDNFYKTGKPTVEPTKVQTPSKAPATPPAQQPDPVQGTLDLKGGVATPSRLDKIKQEQAVAERKQQRAAKDKEAKDLAAMRKQAEKEVLAKNPNVTSTEFDALVDLRMRSLRKGTAKPVAPATPAPTETKTEQPATKQIDDAITQMDKDNVFSLNKTGESRGLSRDKLREVFTADGRDGELLRKAASSGKLQIIKNASQLGEGETISRVAKGVTMGKNGEVYLFADNLNDKDLVATLVHEVKHSVDKKANNKGQIKSGSVRSLVGDKANNQLITQILDLASKGNTAAKNALNRVESASKVDPLRTKPDELVTYFMEETELARKNGKILGRAKGVLNDIASAIRTGVKDATGIPINVTAKDLNFLAKKMAGEMKSNLQYNDKGELQFSLIGPTAKNWNKITSEEFEGAMDGKPRKELNTSKAKANETAILSAGLGEKVTAKDVLAFDELYEAYPELADITVKYTDKDTTSNYNDDRKEIILGKNVVTADKIKKVMLHELQHAVQYKEGFELGDSFKGQLPSSVRDEFEISKNAMDAAVRFTDPATTARIAGLVKLPAGGKADSVLWSAARQFDELDAVTQAKLKNIPQFQAYKKQFDKYMPLYSKALDSYMAAAGEVESRLVEARTNLTEQERRDTPFYDTLKTSRYASNEGKITKDSMKKSEIGQKLERRKQGERQADSVDLSPYDGKRPIEVGSVVEFTHGLDGTITKAGKMEPNVRRGLVKGSKKVERKDGTSFNATLVTPMDGPRAGKTVTLQPDNILSVARPDPDDMQFSLLPEKFTNESQLKDINITGASPRSTWKKHTEIVSSNKYVAKAKEAGKGIKELFLNRVPTELREITDRFLGEKNVYALRALNHLNNINENIRATGDVENALAALRDYETYDLKKDADTLRAERVQKAAKLKQRYPAVFAAYNDARRDIALMSKEIAWYLEGQGGKLTEEQKAVINSINNNIGNYLTTTYKAFGPKKVRAAYVRWLETPEGRAKKKAARDWAEQNIYNLDDLEDKSTGWLQAAYEGLVTSDIAAIKDIENMSRKELITELEAVKPNIRHDVRQKALDQFVEDLTRMGRGAQAVSKAASIYLGSAQNQTIVTPKKEVPEVIRELWGEQDNPVMNVFATLVRQGEYVAKARSQLTMLTELRDKYIFDNAADAPRVEGSAPVKITSSALGILKGKYTTPDIKAFIESKAEADRSMAELVQSMKINDENLSKGGAEGLLGLARALGWAGSKYKKFSVVYKPYNWIVNYAGSPMQMAMNGNFNPKRIVMAHKIAAESIGSPFKSYSSEQLQEVVRNGILDSALAGEIQEVEKQNIIQGIISGDKSIPTPSALTKFDTRITDAYASADIWAKVANYYKEKDFVRDLYKALGQNLTEVQLERLAAERTRRTNFSYNRAIRPAKFLERNGITNFFTYNTETVRTAVNNLRQGVEDMVLANRVAALKPEAASMLRTRAIQRFVGVGTAIGAHVTIYSGVGAVLSAAMGGPEEDENERIIKQGLSGYLNNAVLNLVGKDGSTREYFDAGRLDPYGPANEIVRRLAEGDLLEAAETAQGLIIFNNLLTQVGDWMLGNRPKTPKMEKVASDFYGEYKATLTEAGMSPEWVDRLSRFAESIIPSVLVTVPTAFVDDDFSERNLMRNLFEASGGRFVQYDAEKEVLNSAKFNVASQIRDARNQWSSWARTVKSPSESDIRSEYLDITNDEFEAWSDMVPVVRAAELAGVPRRIIQDRLKKAGLNQEQVNNLVRKKFYPTVLSREKLTADMQTEIEALDKKDKKYREKVAKIREKYRTITPVVTKLNRNYDPHEDL